MAVTAKKQRDPNDPVQILRSKKHGEIRVDGVSFMDGLGVGIHIVKTPAGGYRHARGGPIRNEGELRKAIPPGEELDKALTWWANKDKWQDTAPRKIAFAPGTGYPIFEDTGEFVEREEDLQAYWPSGDILWAAIRALGKRREAKVEQPEPRVTLGVVQGTGPFATESPVAEVGHGVRPEVDEPAPAPKVEAKPQSTKKPLTKAQLKTRREKLATTAGKKTQAAAPAVE